MVDSWNPNLFVYLGDVYEKGTSTEFYNWYGTPDTYYGRFRDVTNPIIGNHEYEDGSRLATLTIGITYPTTTATMLMAGTSSPSIATVAF